MLNFGAFSPLGCRAGSLANPVCVCLQAVPPCPGGRAAEPHLARPQTGPPNSEEALVLSGRVQAGLWALGGTQSGSQFS